MESKLENLLKSEWADLNHLIKESVEKNRDWYRKKASVPMHLYRWLVALVILLGAVISLIAFIQNIYKSDSQVTGRLGMAIFILSLISSVITAYVSFFQLQATWESRRLSELQLTNQLMRLKLEWIKAADISDPAAARKAACEAAEKCIAESTSLVTAETIAFFSGMTASKSFGDNSKSTATLS